MNVVQAVATVWLSALVMSTVLPARADDSSSKNSKNPKASAENTKTFTGAITLIDVKDGIIKVKGGPFSKAFKLANPCTIALADKKVAGANDLRSGQRVAVTYRSVAGVHLASRIAEERLAEEGKIESIDMSGRKLTLRQLGSGKTFKIPADCKVLTKDGKTGSFEHLKVGERIKVLYDTPGDGFFARQIEQRSASFAGSLTAIDVPDRTLKAKHLFETRKFVLARGCIIVVNGKSGGELKNFRLGQDVNLEYDEVDGVNVVTRIVSDEEPKAVTTTRDRATTAVN